MKDLRYLNGVIAHRGLHGYGVPENSMEAFNRAIKKNLVIEMDVHALKDRTLVVFHDDSLYRMCGVRKYLKNCTYDDIKNLYLLDSKYKIPLFEDVLKFIGGKVPIIVELKYDRTVGILEKEVIRFLDTYNGEFFVKSFNPFSVLWFRVFRRRYKRGLLISGRFKNFKDRFIKSRFVFWLCNPDFISCNYRMHNNKVIRKYKMKKPVIAWTINSDEKFGKYREKFNGVICENVSFKKNELTNKK